MANFLSSNSFGFISSGGGGGGGTSNVKVCSIASGTSIVDISERLGYNGAIYNFTVYDCVNYMGGTIFAVWNPQTSQIDFSLTTTNSIGSTVGVSFGFSITGNDINLEITVPTSSWKMSFFKVILEDCCTKPYNPSAFITTESGNQLITEGIPDFLVDNLGNLIVSNAGDQIIVAAGSLSTTQFIITQ